MENVIIITETSSPILMHWRHVIGMYDNSIHIQAFHICMLLMHAYFASVAFIIQESRLLYCITYSEGANLAFLEDATETVAVADALDLGKDIWIGMAKCNHIAYSYNLYWICLITYG